MSERPTKLEIASASPNKHPTEHQGATPKEQPHAPRREEGQGRARTLSQLGGKRRRSASNVKGKHKPLGCDDSADRHNRSVTHLA